jgi:hypothetical protein
MFYQRIKQELQPLVVFGISRRSRGQSVGANVSANNFREIFYFVPMLAVQCKINLNKVQQKKEQYTLFEAVHF